MGKKRMKGEAAIYDETKKATAIALTPTAVLSLDVRARELNLSRSELVEKLARQEVAMCSDDAELVKKIEAFNQIIDKWVEAFPPNADKLARWQKAWYLVQELLAVLEQS